MTESDFAFAEDVRTWTDCTESTKRFRQMLSKRLIVYLHGWFWPEWANERRFETLHVLDVLETNAGLSA